MVLDCEISPSVRVICNGLDLLLLFLILFACKSVIVLLISNVRLGFGPLVICVPQLLGQHMPVAVLLCFGQICVSQNRGLNQMGGFCFVNFVFVTKSFVSVLSTLLIFTQHIISSLTMFPSALIRLSLLCSLDILTLFLTGLLNVADQVLLMYLASLFVL